jgi:hypothetical protein
MLLLSISEVAVKSAPPVVGLPSKKVLTAEAWKE